MVGAGDDSSTPAGGFIPKGWLPLREAVIRLAELRAPDAGVRAYLTPPAEPPPAPGSVLGDATSVGPKWQATSWGDPPEGPDAVSVSRRHTLGTARVPDSPPLPPAGRALEAARAELRQMLEAGEPRTVVTLPSGRLEPLRVKVWRTHEGYGALRTGKLDGNVVLLVEVDFERRIAGDIAPLPPANPPARARREVYTLDDVDRVYRLLAATYEAAGWPPREQREKTMQVRLPGIPREEVRAAHRRYGKQLKPGPKVSK
jgi:hypothetical protein